MLRSKISIKTKSYLYSLFLIIREECFLFTVLFITTCTIQQYFCCLIFYNSIYSTMQLNCLTMPSINSYKLFLFAILICSILNLTGDIKAQSFEHPNFEDIDTSMSKTVVSSYLFYVPY